MLDITPNSFYFIFTPPCLVKTYDTIEPIGFASPAKGCSSRIWNAGSFGFDSSFFPCPILPLRQKSEAMGILVVPALAVEAQQNSSTRASLEDILPNSIPFWYWFGELLIPGFIGDRREYTIDAASNVPGDKDFIGKSEFAVKYSVKVQYGNG